MKSKNVNINIFILLISASFGLTVIYSQPPTRDNFTLKTIPWGDIQMQITDLIGICLPEVPYLRLRSLILFQRMIHTIRNSGVDTWRKENTSLPIRDGIGILLSQRHIRSFIFHMI